MRTPVTILPLSAKAQPQALSLSFQLVLELALASSGAHTVEDRADSLFRRNVNVRSDMLMVPSQPSATMLWLIMTLMLQRQTYVRTSSFDGKDCLRTDIRTVHAVHLYSYVIYTHIELSCIVSYVRTYASSYTYAYVRMCVHVRMHMYVCVFMYVCIFTYVCSYTYVCICTYVCVFMYVCICMYVCSYTYIYDLYVCMYVHTNICSHVYTHVVYSV